MAVAALVIAVVSAYGRSVAANQGQFVYALDDAYIHMAMAKNVAGHGVWGITRHGFTSSSSSPLWTLLLAGVAFLFGSHDLTPFLLNTLLAVLLCLVLDALLRTLALPAFLRAATLLATVLLVPLPALIFCGLEHTLHALLALLFVALASRFLAAEARGPGAAVPLGLTALFLVATRYEGLFLVAMVAFLLLLRRRLPSSLLLVAAAALPVLVYGAWSLREGWYLLPNSVLLKGRVPPATDPAFLARYVGYSLCEQLWAYPHLLVLMAAVLLGVCAHASDSKQRWSEIPVMAAILLPAILLHLLLGRTGSFFRYEAYLVVLGLFVTAASLRGRVALPGFRAGWKEALPRCLATAYLVALACVPLVLRGRTAAAQVVPATANIHQQQYQMARFLKQFYPDTAVAANDVGAINYLADIRCLDIWGLASMEVARAKRTRRFSTAVAHELAEAFGVRIALIYEEWLQRDGATGAPQKWVKVGEWRIPNNIVCGSDTVAFYAVDPSEAGRLAENMRAFAPELPREVVQVGAFLAEGPVLPLGPAVVR